MEWDEDSIQRIRQLWAEGHSTAEIGRRMGVSKNAIVGKAHRLVLPPRPSPIRRDSVAPKPPRRPALPRVTGPTLPPMSSAAPSSPRVEETPVIRAPAPVAEPKPVIRSVPSTIRSSSRMVMCCWPIGEPGTRDFHFCDADALNGKPYCAAHAQVAYVKVRDKREEAA